MYRDTLRYHEPVPERSASIDDLTALLQELRLQRAGAQSPAEVTQAQTHLLLARITSLTDTLRGAEWNDPVRAAARLLLADLAMVAAQLRGNATATGHELTGTLERVRAALERSADGKPATIP